MTDDEMNALKPCPFCGGKEIARDSKQIGYSHQSYRCGYCGARTATFSHEEVAIRAWNRRADATGLIERNASLEAKLATAREALETAMEWIKGWDVGFIFEDEWPADEAKINAALDAIKDDGRAD